MYIPTWSCVIREGVSNYMERKARTNDLIIQSNRLRFVSSERRKGGGLLVPGPI